MTRMMYLVKGHGSIFRSIGSILLFVGTGSLLFCSSQGASATEMTGNSIEAEAAVRRGRTLSITECSGCHRVYRPNEYSRDEWSSIVRKMGARASLNESQMRDLEAYYVAAAKATK
jgi:hypothetical protein